MMDEYINRIIDYFESEAIPKNYNRTLKYMDIEKILTEYEQDLEQEIKDEYYNSGYDQGWDDGRDEGLKEGYENAQDEMMDED
jgi:flagellar biosynthesis/type III secretory pathway protein FliH